MAPRHCHVPRVQPLHEAPRPGCGSVLPVPPDAGQLLVDVLHGDTLGDANHQCNTGLCSFDDGITSKSWGYKDDAHIRTGCFYRICNGIENGPVEVRGSTLSRGNTTHNLGAVFNHLCGMKCAFSACKSLYNDFLRFVDEN